MAHELLAIGVDGARGGWLAAAAFGSKSADRAAARAQLARTELHFFPAEGGSGGLADLASWRLVQAGGRTAPVAIDVPIGLPELGGSRPCDYECRAQLPGKASSVFPVPARFLVEQFETGSVTKDQLRSAIQERRHSEDAAGRDPAAVAGISTQSCAIFSKVWEADRLVRRDQRPDGTWPVEDWMFEVHPELCFERMRTVDALQVGPTVVETKYLAGKKSGRGQLQRLALVRAAFPDAESSTIGLDWSELGRLDDALDAYAALWTALRIARLGVGDVETLGCTQTDSGDCKLPRDAQGTGLLMRIVA